MRYLTLLSCLLSFCAWNVAQPGDRGTLGTFHTTTEWQLEPSLKYDALCLLNALSGDPYYLHYYQAEYDHFHPLFTPQEKAAFVELKHVIKDEAGSIISAKLALYYSVVGDETLPEMIRTAQDSRSMEAALEKTAYFDENDWKIFERSRPALTTALEALNRAGFADYWERTAKPAVQRRIEELKPDLPKYNIVPAIERRLGFALPSQTVKVYLLAYSEPHGIRITGLRFLTHESYPFDIVLHNAIHESMHPPYDTADPRVKKAIELLSLNPVVADKVAHHDASFGYNSAAGYIEEDSVQALEQIVSEQFGVGRDARRYWKEQDGGMHVLAAVFYTKYKAALQHEPVSYSEWFVHAVNDGELGGDKLQAVARQFFSESPADDSKQ
jgi:hypothetical protein